MKTKNFIWFVIGLLIILSIIVIGNIIVIGDRISSYSIVCSWLFYSIVLLFVLLFIIIPICKILTTPEINGLPSAQIDNLTPDELTHYISRIKLTKEQKKQLSRCNDRRVEIKSILDSKYSEMEDVVKKNATTVFVISAISQNGTIDFLSNIGMNFGMINSLIKLCGYRPSYIQLVKLYLSVFSVSLLIVSVDDILEDMDFSELCGSAGMIISNIFTRSIANGAMNAFLALRVGYATKKYLELGGKIFEKKKNELRKEIRKEAKQSLLVVSKEGMKEGGKKMQAIFR